MNESSLTRNEALALLESDKARRAERFQAAVQALITEHSCDLVAVPHIVDGRIMAVIQIVPK